MFFIIKNIGFLSYLIDNYKYITQSKNKEINKFKNLFIYYDIDNVILNLRKIKILSKKEKKNLKLLIEKDLYSKKNH